MSNIQNKFPSIPVPKEVLNKVKKQIEILAQQGITEESFREAVDKKIKEKGISFVSAVYKTFDEFFEKEIRISGVSLACKKGCGQCCNVLISCTEAEINEVTRFINSLPRITQTPLRKKVMVYAREWRDYYRDNEFKIKINSFKPFNDWAGKFCCFLNKEGGYCEIYDVRIMDCRTLTSLTSCETGKMQTIIPCELQTPGPGRFRLQCELWANNFVLEEEQRKLFLPRPEFVPVSPVYHWLWLKRKEF